MPVLYIIFITISIYHDQHESTTPEVAPLATKFECLTIILIIQESSSHDIWYSISISILELFVIALFEAVFENWTSKHSLIFEDLKIEIVFLKCFRNMKY